MDINKLSNQVIGLAIDTHKELGPGLLESAYEMCFCHELSTAGIVFERQKNMPVHYKGLKIDCGYKIDILVESAIVIELKVVERLLPLHEAQLLTYMNLGDWKLGFLMNFNVSMLKNGIRRRVLNFYE
jgi:GxxExxY protein